MYGFAPTAYTTFVVGIVFSILAGACIVLRFLIRLQNKTPLGQDDWWLIPGFLSMITLVGLTDWGLFANPSLSLTPDPSDGGRGLTLYLKSLYFNVFTYYFSISCIKFSVIFLYRRIFSTPTFLKISTGIGLLCLAYMIVGVVAGFLYCRPMEHFWNPTVEGECFNFDNFFLVMSIVEILIDVALLLLPLRMIAKLQLNLQKKLMLCGIFALGIFVTVTGIVRLTILYQPKSETLSFANSDLWIEIQLGTAIVCACLPLYRPLFTKIAKVPTSIRATYGSMVKDTRNTSKLDTVEQDNASNKNSRYARLGYKGHDLNSLTGSTNTHTAQIFTGGKGQAIPMHSIHVNEEVEVV
ncbi:MAG: hypothetical protein M1820_000948 [Bogoriella megaspora]|nr:MAG: hypothetical protein M1820_000948 [Bogoriella megaspora]